MGETEVPQPAHQEDSIGSLFSRLLHDAQEAARAYLRLYKARALGRLDAAKLGLAMGVASLLLVNAAVIALLVGLMLVLEHHIGAGWAVVAVIGGALLLSAILGWLAVSGLRKAFSGTEK